MSSEPKEPQKSEETFKDSFRPSLYKWVWGGIFGMILGIILSFLWFIYFSGGAAIFLLGAAVMALIFGMAWIVLAYLYRNEQIREGKLIPEHTFFAELFYGKPVNGFIPKEIIQVEMPTVQELIGKEILLPVEELPSSYEITCVNLGKNFVTNKQSTVSVLIQRDANAINIPEALIARFKLEPLPLAKDLSVSANILVRNLDNNNGHIVEAVWLGNNTGFQHFRAGGLGELILGIYRYGKFHLCNKDFITPSLDNFELVEGSRFQIEAELVGTRASGTVITQKFTFRVELEPNLRFLQENERTANEFSTQIKKQEHLIETQNPNIVCISESFSLWLKFDDEMFRDNSKDTTHLCIVAQFENMPKKRGKVESIDEVRAQITYYYANPNGKIGDGANYGCWVNERLPKVLFSLADRKYLVLGAFKSGVHNNPVVGDFMIFEYSPELQKPICRTTVISAPLDMIIQVKLVMGKHGELSKDFEFSVCISKDGTLKAMQTKSKRRK